MSVMVGPLAALQATTRFGFGPRPGDLAAIAEAPRDYVLAQIGRSDAAVIADVRLPSSAADAVAAYDDQQARKAARDRLADKAADTMQTESMQSASMSPASGEPMAPGKPPASAMPAAPQPAPRVTEQIVRAEVEARFTRAATGETPFVERLVGFWSNHFAINADKAMNRAVIGAFEREAIRPHVLGRFEDMAMAVARHPAMLAYLDNRQSIGPDSKAGLRSRRGLNENLAREIMELHTVGVHAGYGQADVTSFAKVLTGWTVWMPPKPGEPSGSFRFNAATHEPGAQTVLGKTYAASGVEQGEAVLRDLAAHPATAAHVADKLVRHFVSDEPLAGLAARLAATFRDTGGDLRAVARALASADEAWRAPRDKLSLPYDFLVGVARATGLALRGPEVMRLTLAMGQPLWRPAQPNGFPDDAASWLGPDAVKSRLDVATALARRVAPEGGVMAFADRLFGDALADDTRKTLSRAASTPQAVALLLMSPEFLRR